MVGERLLVRLSPASGRWPFAVPANTLGDASMLLHGPTSIKGISSGSASIGPASSIGTARAEALSLDSLESRFNASHTRPIGASSPQPSQQSLSLRALMPELAGMKPLLPQILPTQQHHRLGLDFRSLLHWPDRAGPTLPAPHRHRLGPCPPPRPDKVPDGPPD